MTEPLTVDEDGIPVHVRDEAERRYLERFGQRYTRLQVALYRIAHRQADEPAGEGYAGLRRIALEALEGL